MSSLSLKTVYQFPAGSNKPDDIRRVNVPADKVSTPFDVLCHFIRTTYSLNANQSILVKYKDEEDELITVSSNIELCDAVSSSPAGKPLRFIVTANPDINVSAVAVSPVGSTPKPVTSTPTTVVSPPALTLPVASATIPSPTPSPAMAVAAPASELKAAVATAPVLAPAPVPAAPVGSPTASATAAADADDDGFLHVSSSSSTSPLIDAAPSTTSTPAPAPVPAPVTDSKSDSVPSVSVPPKEDVIVPTPATAVVVVDAAPNPVPALRSAEPTDVEKVKEVVPEAEPVKKESPKVAPVVEAVPTPAPAPVSASAVPVPRVVTPIIATPVSASTLVKASAVPIASVAAAPKIVVHDGVSCDGCGQKPIRGIRYNCITCPNYDLCVDCEKNPNTHPVTHAMLKIRKPIDYVALAAPKAGTDKKAPSAAAVASAAVPKPVPASHFDDSLKADFIADVSIPDGSVVRAGDRLRKIWSMKNTGSRAWPEGTTLSFVGGEVAPAPVQPVDAVVVPLAKPGATVSVGIDLVVPANAAPKQRMTGYYRLTNAAGVQFGSRVWIEVVIAEQEVKASVEVPKAVAATPAVAAAPALAPVLPVAKPVKPAEAAAPVAPSNFKYQRELDELKGMGFADAELVAYLLTSNNGDVGRVVNWLLANSH